MEKRKNTNIQIYQKENMPYIKIYLSHNFFGSIRDVVNFCKALEIALKQIFKSESLVIAFLMYDEMYNALEITDKIKNQYQIHFSGVSLVTITQNLQGIPEKGFINITNKFRREIKLAKENTSAFKGY